MHLFLSSYLVISSFCGWILPFLIPLIVEELTGSAFYTATTYAVSYLPYFLIMPIGGALADVFNKKSMMQILELVNVLLIGSLIIAISISKHIGITLLLHFMLCSVVAVQHPVFQGMIPSIVSQENAKDFHAYTGIINNTIALIAPGLTGLLLIYFDKKALFYGLLGGYALSFLLISWVPYHHHDIQKEWGIKAITKGLKEAFIYVRSEPFFKHTIIFFALNCFSNSFIAANLIHHLKHCHGISAAYVSYYHIPMGLGSIIGSILATYIVGRLTSVQIILYASTIKAITTWALLFSPQVWFLISLRALKNALASIIIVAYFTQRQKIAPAHLLSRTVAITRMLAWAPIPLASVSSGFLFDITQNFQYLIIGSGLTLSLALVACWHGLMLAELPLQEERVPSQGYQP